MSNMTNIELMKKYLVCDGCRHNLEYGIHGWFDGKVICNECTSAVTKFKFSRKTVTCRDIAGVPYLNGDFYTCDNCKCVISPFSSSWNRGNFDVCDDCVSLYRGPELIHFSGFLTNTIETMIGGSKSPVSELISMLIEKYENFTISGRGIEILMRLLAEGAHGKTRSELMELAGGVDMHEVKKDENFIFSSSKGIVKSEFGKLATVHLGVTTEFANKEIEKLTEIKNAIDNIELMTIANITSFKCKWLKSFREADEYKFGTSETFLALFGTRKCRCLKTDDWMAAAVPGVNSYVLFIQPLDDSKFGEIGSEILGIIDKFERDAVEKKIDILIPKISIETNKLNLTDIIRNAGAKTAFTTEADFSGISNVQMYIHKICQSATFVIDEIGASGKAVTTAVMKLSMSNYPKFRFNNRHFIIAIENGITKFICGMLHGKK